MNEDQGFTRDEPETDWQTELRKLGELREKPLEVDPNAYPYAR